MATYLSVPLKKTSEVDLVKPLRSFIENTYSTAQPEDYNNALSEFNKLRNQMISKSVDKHESALEVLNRYYDQLVSIENKLPISENQIRVTFKWRDAFDKETLFSGKKILAISSGGYEKVCMLFNIAAMQSQIAAVQNVESDEGLKLATKYFQQSCGIFGQLKDTVLSHVQQEPTPDLNPDALNALSALMLAQAQETFYRKVVQDEMKAGVIAKVAYQCSELYADAMKLMQLPSISSLWPKDWLQCTVMKQAAFHAMAQYYQSVVSQGSKSYGEEISRLKHANDLMTSAQSRGGSLFSFRNDHGRIQRALEAAQKDNNFIYHDKVPDVKTLPVIGKAAVAKPLPVTTPMSEKATDLFEKLVPLEVHNAMVAFENRRSAMMNAEVGRLRDATQLMDSVLASLNLPAALEDLSGNKVPESVLEKARKIREEGGMAAIDSLMQELPSLLSRNREIMNESWKLLDEEEASDKQLKDQFGERWSRTPSPQLTAPMRVEGAKYRTILDTAVQADHIVQEKYSVQKQAITTLSKPVNEIEAALPSGVGSAAVQNSAVVTDLRKMMTEVDAIKSERVKVEEEIKNTDFDMSSKFLQALAEDGAINEDNLSTNELDRVYGPLREQVSNTINRQEQLLANVQSANTKFCEAKQSNTGAAQREAMLKDLAQGYDMFMQLKSNLQEGTTFYNDLTPLLVKFQSKVSDFCFARKTEKDELMADLQRNIANQPTQAPPQTPQYQQPASSTPTPAPVPAPRSSAPPSRPPRPAAAATPPAMAARSAAPAPSSQPPAAHPSYAVGAALPYSVNPPYAAGYDSGQDGRVTAPARPPPPKFSNTAAGGDAANSTPIAPPRVKHKQARLSQHAPESPPTTSHTAITQNGATQYSGSQPGAAAQPGAPPYAAAGQPGSAPYAVGGQPGSSPYGAGGQPGSWTPYAPYPATGAPAAMPMPGGYNPYMSYGQAPPPTYNAGGYPYPQQPYPGQAPSYPGQPAAGQPYPPQQGYPQQQQQAYQQQQWR